jgi:lysophospholipase L1-like esterase
VDTTRGRVGVALRSIVLAIASVVATIGVLEAGLRLARLDDEFGYPRSWNWTVYDPVMGRRNVPGYALPGRGLTIDSRGLRGPEVSAAKPHGTVRVACLGDSATFGIWLANPVDLRTDVSYPAEVERLARADGRAVEVVNAGVLGATTGEGLPTLLVQVLPLAPDVITIRFGNNDHGRAWAADVTPMATNAEYAVVRWTPTWLLRLKVTRLAFHAYRQWIAHQRTVPQPQRVPPPEYERNLRRFVTIARAHGIRIVFLDFPYREIERGLSPREVLPNPMQAVRSIEELFAVHDHYQDIMRRVARETGTPVVETLSALRATPGAFTDYDLSHPSGTGYRVIARRLYDELVRLGYLEPSG